MFESLEQISGIPLFKSVAEKELKAINEALQEVRFNQGDVIISEGEVGDCLYLIKNGQVKVVSNLKDDAEEIVLSYLVKGDYFGEMSLITGEPRSATVIAETDVSLWQLDKKDFDTLMLRNPSITLSLTHMLSQRLRLANKARESSERYYKHKITPRGKLQEIELIKLLKYVEENSLTGKMSITHDERTAIFTFKKGQLEHLEFEDKDENEAMDELLQWQAGEFIIEPSVFKITEQDDESPEELLKRNATCNLFEKYIKEKISFFIRIAGVRNVQSALNKSFHIYSEYFEAARDFKIQVIPELDIHISAQPNWSEKHTLFLAVLMRDVITTLSRDLVGMEFWDARSVEEQINQCLDENEFLIFYKQAADFTEN